MVNQWRTTIKLYHHHVHSFEMNHTCSKCAAVATRIVILPRCASVDPCTSVMDTCCDAEGCIAQCQSLAQYKTLFGPMCQQCSPEVTLTRQFDHNTRPPPTSHE
jgi:hypothetical protein